MEDKEHTGKVYFIGAGPGDPELLTLKGARVLGLADVILYDRLVSESILSLTKPHAEIILTGKQKGGDSTSQSVISQLIVEYALQGKTVARLKGGDVSFFSNILDELEAVTQHNITFEIIPGVTAASGCAAYAGIPLTARGYSKSVRILTLHETELFTESNWKELAYTEDTLVFYMSSTNLNFLAAELVRNGADANTPLAVIEQGTTSHQQNHFSILSKVEQDFAGIKFSSPTLLIIGKVVSLAKKFDWRPTQEEGIYFKELNSIQ